jgi:hypothetical protein
MRRNLALLVLVACFWGSVSGCHRAPPAPVKTPPRVLPIPKAFQKPAGPGLGPRVLTPGELAGKKPQKTP